METVESQNAEALGVDYEEILPRNFVKAQKVPRVAGKRVPKDLIIEWYDKLDKDGFNELESFNAHMYAKEDVPIKNIWRQKLKQGVLRKLNSGEEDYWRAARIFYWDWSGWDLPAYQRFGILRQMWWEYIEGTTYWLMAQKFSTPNKTLNANTVTYYMIKLKHEFKRWALQNNALPEYKPRQRGKKNDKRNHN